MKCANCNEHDLKRIKGDVYICDQCEEIFTLDKKGKQSPVADKKKLFEELQETYKVSGQKLKELSNKFGFSVEDDEGEDDGLLPFC